MPSSAFAETCKNGVSEHIRFRRLTLSDPFLLGFDQASRLDAYRAWVADAVSAEAMIEDQLKRRARPAKIGRPRKQTAARESAL